MYICLNNHIGSMVATDIPLNRDQYAECDGSKIYRKDYPEYFKAMLINDDSVYLPNLKDVTSNLDMSVKFYIIVR